MSLTENEAEKLQANATLCGLTRSEYLRMLMRGKTPKPKPPPEFWELMNGLYYLHDQLKAISLNCPEIESDTLNRQHDIQKLILALQAKFTQPERSDSDYGNDKNLGD